MSKQEKPELFRRVYIHSEADLPKETGSYYAHEKDVSQHTLSLYQFISNDDLYAKDWVDVIDWYLIESPVQQSKEDVIDLIDRYWKFDDMQHPVSSWHDKQDLIKAVSDLQSSPVAQSNTESAEAEMLTNRIIDRIRDNLLHATMVYWQGDDEDPYPLKDFLSGESHDISRGIDEIDNIIEQIEIDDLVKEAITNNTK
jgi:hypothetical protein